MKSKKLEKLIKRDFIRTVVSSLVGRSKDRKGKQSRIYMDYCSSVILLPAH